MSGRERELMGCPDCQGAGCATCGRDGTVPAWLADPEVIGEHAWPQRGQNALPCAGCGRPVLLGEPHLSVERKVERHHRGSVVLYAEVIATLHLRCAWGIADADAPAESGVVSADEPIPYVLTEAAVGVRS